MYHSSPDVMPGDHAVDLGGRANGREEPRVVAIAVRVLTSGPSSVEPPTDAAAQDGAAKSRVRSERRRIHPSEPVGSQTTIQAMSSSYNILFI
jgi:hypothetical protein